ncbi:hypothetical protein LAZ67_5001343 [Cordylochernes scorpioides]|uniref:Uncharacterized protein n=1 Tax=Cordylochernes scorpioides TaxID=51811 RepID=A0ABY6KGM8_9ARAC|nr:hypothetical protein LAZ67_5001343 [Cordylochernes scorpioides]
MILFWSKITDIPTQAREHNPTRDVGQTWDRLTANKKHQRRQSATKDYRGHVDMTHVDIDTSFSLPPPCRGVSITTNWHTGLDKNQSTTRASLEDSVIAGIPQIARSKGWVTYIKSFFFLGCWVGFFYQTFKFFSIILENPVVLNVNIISPSSIPTPAVTICSTNCKARIHTLPRTSPDTFATVVKTQFNKYKYCKENPDHCEKGENGPKVVFFIIIFK